MKLSIKLRPHKIKYIKKHIKNPDIAQTFNNTNESDVGVSPVEDEQLEVVLLIDVI